MTELAAPQISSLMEALPGIAAVLRSPVASAIVSLSRAGLGLEEFRLSEAEELLRYGVRRNLLAQDEVDRVLEELRAAMDRRPAKPAAAPEKPARAEPAAKPEKKAAAPARPQAPARSASKPATHSAKPAKAAKPPTAKAAPKKAAAKAPAKKPIPKRKTAAKPK